MPTRGWTEEQKAKQKELSDRLKRPPTPATLMVHAG